MKGDLAHMLLIDVKMNYMGPILGEWKPVHLHDHQCLGSTGLCWAYRDEDDRHLGGSRYQNAGVLINNLHLNHVLPITDLHQRSLPSCHDGHLAVLHRELSRRQIAELAEDVELSTCIDMGLVSHQR